MPETPALLLTVAYGCGGALAAFYGRLPRILPAAAFSLPIMTLAVLLDAGPPRQPPAVMSGGRCGLSAAAPALAASPAQSVSPGRMHPERRQSPAGWSSPLRLCAPCTTASSGTRPRPRRRIPR